MTTTRIRSILLPGAAAVWSGTYAVAAVAWARGAPHFPFEPAGDLDSSGLHTTAGWAAPALAVAATLGYLLAGGLVLARLRGRVPRGRARTAVIAGALLLAVPLTVVVPGLRLLAMAGYAPVFVVGAPFGWPEEGFGFYFEAWTWPLVHQLICLAGGVLWAAVALSLVDRRALLDTARRWTRTAVAVAVVVPVLYAAERISWALGIPLGASAELVRDLNSGDGQWAALGLGLGALGGAVLTLGLVQRWGEVFPRWMIGLRGRRVPVLLAVLPAGFVALVVTAAGVSVLRLWLTGELGSIPDSAIWPMLPWPLWGIGLGVATAGYYRRRTFDSAGSAGSAPADQPSASTDSRCQRFQVASRPS